MTIRSKLRLVDDAAHLIGHLTPEWATLFLEEIGGLVQPTVVSSDSSDALKLYLGDDSSSSTGDDVQKL